MPHSLIGSSSGSRISPEYKPPKRDLGRGDQAEIRVGDAIDLRFRPAGNVAGALQNLIACQVGRDRGREAFPHQQLEGIALQGQFQQHGVVLQKVKAMSGDFGAGFEIDEP